MQDKSDIVRLPARLFKGDDLHLPLNTLGLNIPPVTLKFPSHFLNDQSVLRLAYDEYHSDGFEHVERSILLELMPEDSTFIDIGAHFGLYSIFLTHCNPQLSCFAFEPEPNNFSVLTENCALNKKDQNIFCYPNAVGARTGAGLLRVNTSMGHHIVRSAENSLDSNLISVNIQSLDDVISDISDKFPEAKGIWIKLDVEGREMDVFSSGQKSLESGSVDGILWEYRVGPIENPYKLEIDRLLRKFGFTSYTASSSNMISLRDNAKRTEAQTQLIKSLSQ